MDLCSHKVIRELMEEAGISFRKEYGQNFLVNRMVPMDIADNCTDEENSLIIEIGPGIGCLTRELAERYAKVVAIEIDRGLIPILKKTLAEYDNVTVINQDVMKCDLSELVREHAEGRPVSVCANLPYYITTPILMYLLESGVKLSSITVMIQNEVAARLTAKAGSKDYGAITAVLGYYGEARRLFKVGASSFVPAPKVDSAVVRIDLYDDKKYKPADERLFFNLIHAAFEMRRKTLQNALSAKLPAFTKAEILEAITSLGFDENIRGERLSTADFAALADKLSEIKRKSDI